MQLEYIFNINNGNIVSLGILQKTHTADEEGNILSSSNQRWLVYPTDENPTDSQEVQDKMNEVFTEEVKAKYQEYLESLKPSQEELDKLEADRLQAKLKAKRESDMLEGEVYTLNEVEYKVSFTKNDGDGLVQVKSAFELGLTETVIRFENGTLLPIKADEFLEFAVWFVNRRNNFFISKGE